MKQKVVYVASRVRGNLQQNLADAKKYCRYCVLQGAVPIVPHHQTASEGLPPERGDISAEKQLVQAGQDSRAFRPKNSGLSRREAKWVRAQPA